MQDMNEPRHHRIDDIEALRAFAVLFTIIGHVRRLLFWGGDVSTYFDGYGAWWAGVDLFFCISGFVIARDLLNRLSHAQTRDAYWRTAIAFWIKRIFRILPTSWLWIAIILVASLIFRNVHTFSPFNVALEEFTAVIVHAQNFHEWACFAHKDLPRCNAAAPWWSLSLEEQFYLVFPVLIFVTRKYLTQILICLVLVQTFIPRHPGDFLFYIRTDAIALGVLLAIFSSSSIYAPLDPIFMRRRVFAFPIISLAMLLIFTLAWRWQTFDAVPYSTGMIAFVSLFLVWIASYNRNYIARANPARALLLWTGSRSFAIYIIHWPMMNFVQTFWRYVEPSGTVFDGRYSFRFLALWIVATIAFAELNFRFVEQPLRRKGREIARRFESDAREARHESRDYEAEGVGSNV